MRKHARKSAQVGLIARPSAFTTQIEADLVLGLSHVQHGYFALCHRCKFLKMLAFPASIRLAREQISSCHLDLSL